MKNMKKLCLAFATTAIVALNASCNPNNEHNKKAINKILTKQQNTTTQNNTQVVTDNSKINIPLSRTLPLTSIPLDYTAEQKIILSFNKLYSEHKLTIDTLNAIDAKSVKDLANKIENAQKLEDDYIEHMRDGFLINSKEAYKILTEETKIMDPIYLNSLIDILNKSCDPYLKISPKDLDDNATSNKEVIDKLNKSIRKIKENNAVFIFTALKSYTPDSSSGEILNPKMAAAMVNIMVGQLKDAQGITDPQQIPDYRILFKDKSLTKDQATKEVIKEIKEVFRKVGRRNLDVILTPKGIMVFKTPNNREKSPKLA